MREGKWLLGLPRPVVGMSVAFPMGQSVDPGGWWAVLKHRCGLLLMGPSGCGAVEVSVPIPLAPFGWAPVFPPRHFGHSLLSSHASSTWHPSPLHIWQLSACRMNVS